jgi:hypothetical protein
MKTIKKLWAPLLLGLLLMLALVGVASARPTARPVAQAWRVLTVGVDACIPENSLSPWDTDGNQLNCMGIPGCVYQCPASFPAAGEQAVGAVNVKRFTMYALDNDPDAPDNVWATLFKSYPPTGGQLTMAHVMTGPPSAGTQTIIDLFPMNNPVYRTQSPYIWIQMGSGGLLAVYGFHIHYTW